MQPTCPSSEVSVIRYRRLPINSSQCDPFGAFLFKFGKHRNLTKTRLFIFYHGYFLNNLLKTLFRRYFMCKLKLWPFERCAWCRLNLCVVSLLTAWRYTLCFFSHFFSSFDSSKKMRGCDRTVEAVSLEWWQGAKYLRKPGSTFPWYMAPCPRRWDNDKNYDADYFYFFEIGYSYLCYFICIIF